MQWLHCMMGHKNSPYMTVQATHLAFEVANGCWFNKDNAMCWDRVVLNLPGSQDYNPTMPWVSRVCPDGMLAGSIPAFVDNLCPIGTSEEHCFRVLHQTASCFGYLGIQNAFQRTRPPSQTPGAWARVIAVANGKGVSVSTSQEKWDKAKRFLEAITLKWQQSSSLEHKPLEEKRGFFMHLQRVYPTIAPFLKGFHLTLDGWCNDRDPELWKIRLNAPDSFWDDSTNSWTPLMTDAAAPPSHVTTAPRLAHDLECLHRLFEPSTPPVHFIRATMATVCDADSTSSNYRELRNLIEALEEGVTLGELD